MSQMRNVQSCFSDDEPEGGAGSSGEHVLNKCRVRNKKKKKYQRLGYLRNNISHMHHLNRTLFLFFYLLCRCSIAVLKAILPVSSIEIHLLLFLRPNAP